MALAARVNEARKRIRSGQADWEDAVRRAFTDKDNNLTAWRTHSRFLEWMERESDTCKGALQALWSTTGPPPPPEERLRGFFEQVPGDVLKSLGERLNIGSFLMMAEDPGRLPPIKISPFRKAWKLAGRGGGPTSSEPSAVYGEILQFLDELAGDGAGWPAPLRDRLDAQSAVWYLAKRKNKPGRWPPEDWDTFVAWRNGGTPPPTDTDHLAAAGHPKYWLIGAGANASVWPEFQRNGVARLGFGRLNLGDLSGLSQDEIEAQIEPELGDKTMSVRALYDFASELSVGDQLLVKKGRTQIVGFGVVTSDYFYDADSEGYAHSRSVTWIRSGQWSVPEGTVLPIKTLTDISARKSLLDSILSMLIEVDTDASGKAEPYTLDQALEGLFVPKEKFVDILQALEVKKNVILLGPPGVGKTFIATRLAYALMQTEDPTRVGFVQFHQSMTYEDFMQGWRPMEGGGFERKNGLFFAFCRKAQADAERPYVFIIDEINRGNLSKVFGELMMLIETDKRGPRFAVPLTYSHTPEEKFHVPSNLHVLGMMNTADRSLAMVDYALRRRFRFFSLMPCIGSDSFRKYLGERGVDSSVVDVICDRLATLNKAIASDTKNLGWGYQIGHSFFCPEADGEGYDIEWYRAVIRTEVAPLLEEYWFDDTEKAEEWTKTLLK